MIFWSAFCVPASEKRIRRPMRGGFSRFEPRHGIGQKAKARAAENNQNRRASNPLCTPVFFFFPAA
ncbi:MAG: hypothetical protein C6P37_01095 [Caldibacillus debilis]|uniref:Uncharacterized protein n=1 Tax=Caldibacillus debilis TaxID=301148 RepID=A0A3E0K8T4_9BACI|nr:hypothetical protein [Bacillaceae bacterium]MBY6271916.1 hypothetical protein [Bacillaceae bacterium]REJ17460.1 MAG: hypothetical protein C6W57_05690 [Caldibacillus debilis]REJ31412.1 MAG: hypothetical protein C6P37_01095 [Caldibacillus debilis]